MKTIAFFNNKGGVGKTTLVYHLAWIFSELGVPVLMADLDPQANVTTMSLPDERLEELWPEGEHPDTIYGAVRPLARGIGDIATPHVEMLNHNVGLLAGDMGLSRFEDTLSDAWPRCQNRDEAAFRKMTAFSRLLKNAAETHGFDIVLIDVGPNLGAINRAAIIASDHVIVPLAPDLLSLRGLENLGPTLREWRQLWDEMKQKSPDPTIPLPSGAMEPIGYVLMQHGIRDSRPVKAYQRWMDKIPGVYRTAILEEEKSRRTLHHVADDPHCLALLKHYRSLAPMAMEVRKPMFSLTSADGAIGAHQEAVQKVHRDFSNLAHRIAEQCGITLS